MMEVVHSIYADLLKVKKRESILIVFDKNMKNIAREFSDISYHYGSKRVAIEMKEAKHSGEEPPVEIAQMMLQYDVLLLITSKSLSHTLARKKATAKGARAVTMPGIKRETLLRCVGIDYSDLKKVHSHLYMTMRTAKVIRVTSKVGTDISFKIYNNKIEYDINLHRKGDFHNIPLGEVFVSPLEGTANGMYVVDGSHAGLGKLRRPLYLTVKKGLVVNIKGERAEELNRLLSSVGQLGYHFAEFGIGTNPKAKLVGNVLEDEKVKGTCHFALGNNFSFGGKVNVPLHLDGIVTSPTIFFDDHMIMKSGKLL